MTVTLAELKKDLAKLVDHVIETGEPVEIERNGHRLKIVLERKHSKLDNLKPHFGIVGDPEELVDLKVWEWDPDKNL
jgi:hypothetical protein